MVPSIGGVQRSVGPPKPPTPQKEAGIRGTRTVQPVSLPDPISASPAAAPEEEPHGTRSGVAGVAALP